MLHEELRTSLAQMQPFAGCLPPVAQLKQLTNEAFFRAHFEFKVSTWPLCISSFFYYKLSFGSERESHIYIRCVSRHFLNHCSPLSDWGNACHHLSGIQGMTGALTSEARGADCGQHLQLNLSTWEGTAAADAHFNQWDCPKDLNEVMAGNTVQILRKKT